MRDGLVMALRRWPTMLALAGMIAVAGVVLAFVLSEVLPQVAVLRGARQLRKCHAVSFVEYSEGPGTTVADRTVRLLAEMIERQEAYTAVLFNMGVGDPALSGAPGLVVLFGDAVPDLFPDLQLPAIVPSAMLGSRLAGQELDAVSAAGQTIPVVGALPAGATFFDPKSGVLRLDHRIVVRAPAELLFQLTLFERHEALSRTVMIAPAYEVVDAFVSGCAQGGLFLIPQGLAGEQHHQLGDWMRAAAMYIASMLGFLALVLNAFVASAHLVIRQEMPAFKIRQLYGATAMHVSLRIGSFLAAVVLVLPVALLASLAVMLVRFRIMGVIGVPPATGPLWVISAVILNFVLLWGRSVRDVLHHDRIGR
ncbi:MAG: hypothetical protein RDU89_12040 [bacterium]|nr:hypothetical protein [bacterium]